MQAGTPLAQMFDDVGRSFPGSVSVIACHSGPLSASIGRGGRNETGGG
jgi:hypothetical protein